MSTPRAAAPRILGIDDDTSQHFIVDRIIEDIDPSWTVEWATSAEEAKALLGRNPYDLVIADCWLGKGATGIELWEQAQAGGTVIPFVFMTSMGADSFIKAVSPVGICPTLLNKPLYPGEAAQVIRGLLKGAR